MSLDNCPGPSNQWKTMRHLGGTTADCEWKSMSHHISIMLGGKVETYSGLSRFYKFPVYTIAYISIQLLI